MNIIDWFKQSNRWKHLLGGAAIGVFANSTYCAAYTGIGVAGAMEFKDYQWGGEPDWIDFSLTCVGTAIGYGARILVVSLV